MVKNLPSMQGTWVQSLGQEDPLEKVMVTHSRILAWRILWTEESGGLQPMRVGHDWATDTFTPLSLLHFSGKEPFCQWDLKDAGSIPGLGASPAGGYGNPSQYSCLENPMHRGAWKATVHRVANRHNYIYTHTHTHIHLSTNIKKLNPECKGNHIFNIGR